MLEALNNLSQTTARGALRSENGRVENSGSPNKTTENIPSGDAQIGAQVQRLDPIEKIENALTQQLGSSIGENSRLSMTFTKAVDVLSISRSTEIPAK